MKRVSQLYQPGTEAGIHLYLPEIVELLSTCLQSQLWSVKAQAARAIATVADKLGGQLGRPHLAALLSAVLDGLSGRTWQGKVICVAQPIENIFSMLFAKTL